MSRLTDFKAIYRTFRIELLSLAYHRTKGVTPFYTRALEAFKADVEAPMDAAWASLPPTERQMFLAEDVILTRANLAIKSPRVRINHK